MCRYILNLIFSTLLLLGASGAYAQTDTATVDTASERQLKKRDRAGHQLCIGVDYFHPAMFAFTNDRTAYEIAVDYYARNEYYLVLEGGFGSSTVNYSDLAYKTTNNFIRFGFNKSVLTRNSLTDWDMMFIGLRVGEANVNRSSAQYSIVDSLWGIVDSATKASTIHPFWAELTGGVRVELVKGLSAGWTIRGKFMLNGKSFNDLSPLYIAGYGRGDKNTSFDFNAYISYGFKWKRKSVEALKSKTSADAAKPAIAPTEKKMNK